MVNKLADKTGNTYGWLTVLHRDDTRTGRVYYICECKCGKQVSRRASRLTDDEFRSCGCYVHNKTHGLSNNGGKKKVDSVYRTWIDMKQRCNNPNDNSYQWYGAKGIKVCDEWLNDFEAFAKHIGPKPSPKHSIDRFPNKNGNYEPGNVRWATQQQQVDNMNPQKIASGVSGIYWNAGKSKWEVYPKINGKRVYKGQFDSLEEAKSVFYSFAEIL